MTDQQRFDTLRCYGSGVGATPNLDALANSGAVFKQCYVASPLCTPSRASLMTGLSVAQHGVDSLGGLLASHHVLLPERLRRLGYQTALFGKHSVSGNAWEAQHRHPNDGFDVYRWCPEPSAHMDSPHQAYAQWLKHFHPECHDRMTRLGRGAGRIPLVCHMSRWAADSAIDFMRQADGQQPFFCMVSLFDPHNPYDDTPLEYERRIDPRRLPRPVGLDEDTSRWPRALQHDHRRGSRLTSLRCVSDAADSPESRGHHADRRGHTGNEPFDAEYLMQLRRGYFASIALIDDEVGRILNELKRMGIEGQTLVIFCSDHGDMLGDHRLMTKGAGFYDPATRVPLLMCWPEMIPTDQRIPHPVQLHDLTATILLAAGAEPADLQHDMPDSHDLMPQACVQAASRRHAVVSTCRDPKGAHGIMLRDACFKLNLYEQPAGPDNHATERFEGQLFNMRADPLEQQDLWDDRRYVDVKKRLIREICEVRSSCCHDLAGPEK